MAAVEILLNTPLVGDLIFKGEVSEIKELMKRSRELGMQTFDQALFDLYEARQITYEDALRNADSRERPAAADQAQQPARAQHRPGRRHRTPEDGLTGGCCNGRRPARRFHGSMRGHEHPQLRTDRRRAAWPFWAWA